MQGPYSSEMGSGTPPSIRFPYSPPASLSLEVPRACSVICQRRGWWETAFISTTATLSSSCNACMSTLITPLSVSRRPYSRELVGELMRHSSLLRRLVRKGSRRGTLQIQEGMWASGPKCPASWSCDQGRSAQLRLRTGWVGSSHEHQKSFLESSWSWRRWTEGRAGWGRLWGQR